MILCEKDTTGMKTIYISYDFHMNFNSILQIYWLGPCAGGATAGLLYHNAFRAAAATPKPADKRGTYEECAKGDNKEVP